MASKNPQIYGGSCRCSLRHFWMRGTTQPRYLESKLFGSYESHEPPLTRADLQIIERIHPTCGWGQIYIVLLDVVNPIINHPQNHHVYPCLWVVCLPSPVMVVVYGIWSMAAPLLLGCVGLQAPNEVRLCRIDLTKKIQTKSSGNSTQNIPKPSRKG